MEIPLAKPEDKTTLTRQSSQDFNQYGHSFSFRRAFGRDGCIGLPRYRLLVLSLGLLNAVLLIAAVVLGIYCAKASYFGASDSTITSFVIEMNALRNLSGNIQAAMEASRTQIAKERINYMQLKLQVEHQWVSSDLLEKKIETLQAKRESLTANKTYLEENCAKCEPEWNLLKSSCYYFSSQHESNPKKNWLDSRADCISKGGDLVMLKNAEEQRLISEYLPSQSDAGTRSWWKKGYWIGLSYKVSEGTWVWVNNVTTETLTQFWINGEPKIKGLQGGNCAAFLYFASSKMMYSGNCTHQYNWICQKQQI